ncbi:hypothetical protein MKW98_029198 [Papaver atlanticum]|uniref:Histidine-containing phosphotransfer protein n=1 Tax=Papaver atlanticum TaxID=357466 RepID=A0AAD4XQ45_9MAGN|nr:hypothetical protein MKW98_029198 [Papaver atlanticum]
MQGTLGKQINVLMSLKHDDEPDFLVIMLSIFCEDTEEKIMRIETQHMKPCLHVFPIATLIKSIKENSLCVGSDQVTQACNQFLKAKKELQIALLQLRREFNHVKFVFLEIVELKEKIIRLTTPLQALDNVTENTGSSSP